MTTSSPVRRIASIIDVVGATPHHMTLIDLAKAVNLPPSTAHRTLNILIDVGYIKLNPTTKTYELGERLKRILLLYHGTGSIKELARPVLVDLAETFTETSYVVQMSDSGLQLVDFYLPTSGSRTLVHPGFDFPMHATASGKAVYAFRFDEEVERELAKKSEKFMPTTIVSKNAIKKELRRAREQGYAINDAELDHGVYAIAAPLKLGNNEVIGAIAIVGIRDRLLDQHKPEDVISAVVKAADDVSRLLLSVSLRKA